MKGYTLSKVVQFFREFGTLTISTYTPHEINMVANFHNFRTVNLETLLMGLVRQIKIAISQMHVLLVA